VPGILLLAGQRAGYFVCSLASVPGILLLAGQHAGYFVCSLVQKIDFLPTRGDTVHP